jgi:hypothetical protein
MPISKYKQKQEEQVVVEEEEESDFWAVLWVLFYG